MTVHQDTVWLRRLLAQLRAPDADLALELLEHMTRLGQSSRQDPAGIPPFGPTVKGSKWEDPTIVRGRAAVFDRIHEGWKEVRDRPPCLAQARLLRETVYFIQFFGSMDDPLADPPARAGLREAQSYIERALVIAEEIGDRIEIAEALVERGRLHQLSTDFEAAQRDVRRAIEASHALGSLLLEHRAWRALSEILTMGCGTPAERIEVHRNCLALALKLGDTYHALDSAKALAHLQVLTDDLDGAAEVAETMATVIEQLRRIGSGLDGHLREFHIVRSLLEYRKGDITAAIREQQVALDSHRRPVRADLLLYDLAWLERLCQAKGDIEVFRQFCDGYELAHESHLERLYLIEDAGPDEEVEPASSSMPSWNWTDPTGKAQLAQETSAVTIAPVMGTGFLRDVLVPRWMSQVGDDFRIDVDVDMRTSIRCAGGLLVYQDDDHLIRFGLGIQADGEVTLTVKTADGGMAFVSRGILEAPVVRMALRREGDLFSAWVRAGDGGDWQSAGSCRVPLAAALDVGVFAECTYRLIALERCETNPMRFENLHVVEQGNQPQ